MSLGPSILAFVVLDHILTTLQHDVQMAFCFPFDKSAQDPYDVTTWHLFLLLPEWCLVLPFRKRAMDIRG
jgi:hypothetical protein